MQRWTSLTPPENATVIKYSDNEEINRSDSTLVEDEIDSGIVLAGQVVEGNILLKNDSSQTYEIVDIRTTCNCSSTFLTGSNTQVRSGATLRIPFSINTSGKFGQTSNTFTLSYRYCGDTRILQCSFRVNMDVWKEGEFRIKPPSLALENCIPESYVEEKIDLLFMPFDSEAKNYQIENVHCPGWLSVNCAGFKKQGNIYAAKLIVSGNIPCFVGEISETVQFCINDKKSTQLTVPILMSGWTLAKATPSKMLKIIKKDDWPVLFSLKMEFQKQYKILSDSSHWIGMEQLKANVTLEENAEGMLFLFNIDRSPETTKRVHKGYYQFAVSINAKNIFGFSSDSDCSC